MRALEQGWTGLTDAQLHDHAELGDAGWRALRRDEEDGFRGLALDAPRVIDVRHRQDFPLILAAQGPHRELPDTFVQLVAVTRGPDSGTVRVSHLWPEGFDAEIRERRPVRYPDAIAGNVGQHELRHPAALPWRTPGPVHVTVLAGGWRSNTTITQLQDSATRFPAVAAAMGEKNRAAPPPAPTAEGLPVPRSRRHAASPPLPKGGGIALAPAVHEHLLHGAFRVRSPDWFVQGASPVVPVWVVGMELAPGCGYPVIARYDVPSASAGGSEAEGFFTVELPTWTAPHENVWAVWAVCGDVISEPLRVSQGAREPR